MLFMSSIMRIPISFFLFSILIIGCSNNEKKKPDFSISPVERLDPKRVEQPYPTIEIPENADLESPRWKGIDLSPKPPVVPVSVLEEKERFVLQDGYQIDPVLTEPDVKEPAAVQFDGNGRMYVLELRSYMQDIDATDELKPLSRISRWEDTDNDGYYDKGVVFLDSLVFPRFVVPFGPGTILSMESNEDNVYKYTDTDDDGKADKKELFSTGLGRSGNVEHQTSFLTWTLDNWMYSTYNALRIRWTPDGVIKEKTGNPYGQWGVTQDNYGQIWFQNGASGVPSNFQFPIVYGNYRVEGQFEEGFRVPYSLIRLEDFEPGMRETKEDGSLNNVTGAAGNDVFRGDRLPKELIGEYFYGEPVARIVRRVHTEKREGLTYAQNYYIKSESEFLQSTDPLFRPVDMATAPDGTMYIVDMYRGIIQEGNWTQEGSYLRTKIQQYQMDDIIENGRIWRVTYEGIKRSKDKPRMFDESSNELVAHLSHPNGWWRDKAQQLLILRQDKSVKDDLITLVKDAENELARIHALWTLEGLGVLEVSLVEEILEDSNPNIRIQALRASETLYKYGATGLGSYYQDLLKDEDVSVVIQTLQTMYLLGIDGIEKNIVSTLKSNSSKGVQVVGHQILENIEEKRKMEDSKYSGPELALFNKGKEIYDGFCSTCHGVEGLGTPTGREGDIIAPAFSGSDRIQGHPEYAVKTLLHGLTGAIDGKEYEGVMVAMDANNDEWIASVISYIRNDFGNEGSFVSPEYVAKIREITRARNTTYNYSELREEIPKVLSPERDWKVTASSTALQGVGSTRDPGYAFTYKGWKSEKNQSPGMYFQVELPSSITLAEIQFESNEENYPRSYSVAVSNDGEKWKEVSSGKGVKGDNIIAVPSFATGKFVRIIEKEGCEFPWGMKQLKLYAR